MSQDNEAKIVHLEDAGGNKIKFFSYRGQPMPAFPGDQELRMRRIGEFPAREDDVYVCGYPKSGGNWLWEICQMLLTGTAEYVKGNKMMAMLEHCDQEHFAEMSSPRCLSHHFWFEDIPPDVFRKGSKMVYIMRNPKDVCVSHYHHNRGLVGVYDYHGNWPDYFEMWLEGKVDYGKWSTHVKGWEKGIKEHPNALIHVIHYENLKLNFDAEARKLADFLGVSRSEEFFKSLSQKCTFTTMKRDKTKVGYNEREREQWRNGEVKFLRKGVIGDWKNHFTTEQNKRFNEMYEREMEDSQLHFVFE